VTRKIKGLATLPIEKEMLAIFQ